MNGNLNVYNPHQDNQRESEKEHSSSAVEKRNIDLDRPEIIYITS